jgi:Tfp pilus assembly protein PilZ
MMEDKRRHKRFIVEGMDINGKLMFTTDVSVINISISGLSIKADRRLDIGREYTLKLEDHERIVTVKGTVVWSSLIGNHEGPHGEMMPVYSAGLKFTDVLNDRITEIINFIEGHVHESEHRLSGIRFNIAKPEKAVIHFPTHYTVKRISAGGMLIESDDSLVVESRFPMELTLPEEKPISFTGRVASCALVKIRGLEHYDVGIEFLEMDQAGRKKLEELIALLNSLDKPSPLL